MKVYVVIGNEWEGSRVLYAGTDKEKADLFLNSFVNVDFYGDRIFFSFNMETWIEDQLIERYYINEQRNKTEKLFIE